MTSTREDALLGLFTVCKWIVAFLLWPFWFRHFRVEFRPFEESIDEYQVPLYDCAPEVTPPLNMTTRCREIATDSGSVQTEYRRGC